MKNFLLIMLCALVLLGCRKNELDYDYARSGKVQISPEWEELGNMPDEMMVYFYSIGDGLTVAEDKPISDYIPGLGDVVHLPFGSYKSFIFNADVDGILFRNMDNYSTAEAYLESNEDPPFATRNTDTRHISGSGMFYEDRIRDFTLGPENLEHEITTRPKLRTVVASLKIKVQNLRVASKVSGTLSGIAESINLSTGETNATTANIIFDLKIDIKDGDSDGYITAEINYFEILWDENESNVLDIAFKLKDETGTELIGDTGYSYPITLDISDEVRKNGGEISLDRISITLPKVEISEVHAGGDGGGGFETEVANWENGTVVELPTE